MAKSKKSKAVVQKRYKPEPKYCLTFPTTREVSARGVFVWTIGTVTSAYIDVEEGQEFEVHWVDERQKAPKHAYDACVELDGDEQTHNGVFIEPDNGMYYKDVALTDPERFVTKSSPRRNQSRRWTFSPGGFSSVEKRKADDADRARKEGSIVVYYKRSRHTEAGDLSDDWDRAAGDEAGLAVESTGWGKKKDVFPQVKFLPAPKAFLARAGFPVSPPASPLPSHAALSHSHDQHDDGIANAVAGPSRERKVKQAVVSDKATTKSISPSASTSSAKARRGVSSSRAPSRSAPTPSPSSGAPANAVAGPSRRAVETQQQPSLASTPASNAPTASRSLSYGGGFEQHNDDHLARAQSATPFLPLHPPSRQSSSADTDPHRDQQYADQSRIKVEEEQTGLEQSKAEGGAVGGEGVGRSSTLRAALQGLPVPSLSNASAPRNPLSVHRDTGPSQHPAHSSPHLQSTVAAPAPLHHHPPPPLVHPAGAPSAPGPSQPRKRIPANLPSETPAPIAAQAETETLILSSDDDDDTASVHSKLSTSGRAGSKQETVSSESEETARSEDDEDSNDDKEEARDRQLADAREELARMERLNAIEEKRSEVTRLVRENEKKAKAKAKQKKKEKANAKGKEKKRSRGGEADGAGLGKKVKIEVDVEGGDVQKRREEKGKARAFS